MFIRENYHSIIHEVKLVDKITIYHSTQFLLELVHAINRSKREQTNHFTGSSILPSEIKNKSKRTRSTSSGEESDQNKNVKTYYLMASEIHIFSNQCMYNSLKLLKRSVIRKNSKEDLIKLKQKLSTAKKLLPRYNY